MMSLPGVLHPDAAKTLPSIVSVLPVVYPVPPDCNSTVAVLRRITTVNCAPDPEPPVAVTSR